MQDKSKAKAGQILAISAEEANEARKIIWESGSVLADIERELRAVGTDLHALLPIPSRPQEV